MNVFKPATNIRITKTREGTEHYPKIFLSLVPKGWGEKNRRAWLFTREELIKLRDASSGSAVYFASAVKPGTNEEFFFYHYKGNFYFSEIELDDEEATLVLNNEVAKPRDALRGEVERIKAIAESVGAHRISIPKDRQVVVWNRDNGKCVNCGSKERLEFDHIIPLSKGGSNTARNIQLMCEKCNREKGSRIG